VILDCPLAIFDFRTSNSKQMDDRQILAHLEKQFSFQFKKTTGDVYYYQNPSPIGYYQLDSANRVVKLFIFNVKLNTFPRLVCDLTALKSITMLHTSIAELQPDIQKLQELTELNLGNNKLTTLPPEFEKLSKLEDLSLMYNEFCEVPAVLRSLPSLHTISLEGNKLTEFPQLNGFDVSRLYLTNNQITIIPHEIMDSEIPIKWAHDGRTGIYMLGNPLKLPPIVILQRGNGAAKEYSKVMQKKGKVPKYYYPTIIVIGRIKQFLNRFRRR